ncbi:SMI1/KNR4 family protein [Cerasicoccus frondis]|uniref:SMI1/KNR4 family protein n=1 Tax=Cerasicoccus frondis TaxID=490090 RepID=UPI002852B7F0|nr:SMI1/KNR4 family protein [Cerasicoccus frondis]
MSFLEKLNFIREEIQRDESLADVVELTEVGASEEFIESLKGLYAFIPESYLQFLRLTDGIDIFGITFCGSGKNRFVELSWLKELASSFLDVRDNFPFAKDSDGSILWINSNGGVFWDSEPETGEQLFLESSFEKFMNEVLFGSQYFTKLNPGGIDEGEEEWGPFLKKYGWA